jgi:hypothetical protein
MRIFTFTLAFIFLISLSGCQEEVQPPAEQAKQVTKEQVVSELTSALTEDPAIKDSPEQTEQKPPSPPLFEDFQGEPQLTLFPRAGNFRPADDSDRLPYWNTFIEHLIKVTGVVEEQSSGKRGWTFRSINTIDSVGFFSPLGVEPLAEYQVSFKITADLAEGASAGIGILEFNEFLWVPAQYTEEMYIKHFRGSQDGQRLTGKADGEHTFTFTTGPETKMIHIVLFREGTHDRNAVMFDDINIARVKGQALNPEFIQD